MKYGYARVSAMTQNIDRQVEDLRKEGLLSKEIYIDKQSGKDFARLNYQRLKKKLKKGDLLFIKSIDRLGRDYRMILEEWFEITKTIEADILVLDMPLLDTRQKAENLIGRFISDVVLQILSFVAENERINIKTRQAEGIKLAKEKGKVFGRPKINLPANYNEIIKNYFNGEITANCAMQKLSMTRSTFYKYSKIYCDEPSIHIT